MAEEVMEKNPQQLAIDSYKTPGAYLVIAGPGTGKTYTISHRIKAILEDKECGATADRILCITFTDAAAKEMKKKFLEYGIPNALSIDVYTYHGFCLSLMKKYPDLFDMANKKEINDIQKQAIVKECIDELDSNLKYLNSYKEIENIIKGIGAIKHNRLSSEQVLKNRSENIMWEPLLKDFDEKEKDIKNNPVDESKYKDEETLKKAIKTFENKLKKNKQEKEEHQKKIDKIDDLLMIYEEYKKKTKNFIDFDDMINCVLDQFEQNPAFLQEVAEQYDFVLVDEYQDTNKSQNDIVFKLAHNCSNTFVVGDDDQIIYAFQGASLTTIEEFLEEFKEKKPIILNNNYRSTDSILRVSEQLANIQDEYLKFYIDKKASANYRNEGITNKYKGNLKSLPLRFFSKSEFKDLLKDSNGEYIKEPKHLNSAEPKLQSEDKNTPVILQEYENEEIERYNIVRKIQQIVEEKCPVDEETNEKKLSEIAVLTRTNAEAENYAALLKEYNIKCQLVKGKNIFQANSVKTLLAYMHFFNDITYKNIDKLNTFMLSKPFHINPNDYALLQRKEMKKDSLIDTIKILIKKSDEIKILDCFISCWEKFQEEQNKTNPDYEEINKKIGNIIQILNSEIENAEQRIEKLNSELNKTEQRIKKLTQDSENIKNEEEKKKELEEKQQELKERKQTFEENQQKLNVKKQELKNLIEKLQNNKLSELKISPEQYFKDNIIQILNSKLENTEQRIEKFSRDSENIKNEEEKQKYETEKKELQLKVQELQNLTEKLQNKENLPELTEELQKYFKDNYKRLILKDKYKLQKLIDDYERLKVYSEGENTKNLIHQMACVTGILQSYISLEINRMENILALKKLEDVAEEFMSMENNATLGDFLTYIDALIDADSEIYTDTTSKPLNAVQVSSLHSSKGREFEYVFMPNLYNKNFESSSESVKEIVPLPKKVISYVEDGIIYDEKYKFKFYDSVKVEDMEARVKFLNNLKLLYVGMTRAKHKLELSYSGTQSYYIEKMKEKVKDNCSDCLSIKDGKEAIRNFPDIFEKDTYDKQLSEAIDNIDNLQEYISPEHKKEFEDNFKIIKDLKNKLAYTIMPDSETKYDYDYSSEEFKEYIDSKIPEVYSASALNTYIKCHKQYFYRYILNLRPYKKQEEDADKDISEHNAEYGTAIHYALECMVNYVKKEGTYPSTEYLDAKFTEKAEEILNNTTESKMQECKVYIKNYVEKLQNPEKQEGKIEAAEYVIKDEQGHDYVEIEGVKICGIIDRLDKNEDGTYNIIDYKTGSEKDSSKFKCNGDYAHYYDQVGMYKYLLDSIGMTVKNVEIVQPQYPKQETHISDFEGDKAKDNCEFVKNKYLQMVKQIKEHNFECEALKVNVDRKTKEKSLNTGKPNCEFCDYYGFCKSKVI